MLSDKEGSLRFHLSTTSIRECFNCCPTTIKNYNIYNSQDWTAPNEATGDIVLFPGTYSNQWFFTLISASEPAN